jgi:protein TonB
MNLPKASGMAGSNVIQVSAPEPAMDTRVKLAGGPGVGGAVADAGVVPLVRIQPMYPRSAAEKKIEGWVLLEFTISKKGTVKNARVIDARPKGVFDRSALSAIRKWKYKPKIKDGVAVQTYGVQVKLTFKLEDM